MNRAEIIKELEEMIVNVRARLKWAYKEYDFKSEIEMFISLERHLADLLIRLDELQTKL